MLTRLSAVLAVLLAGGALLASPPHKCSPGARLTRAESGDSVPQPPAAEEGSLSALVRKELADHRQHLSPQAVEDIRIEARHGIVRLVGDVPRTTDRLLVGVLARSVSGVRGVVNELVVKGEDLPPCHGG